MTLTDQMPRAFAEIERVLNPSHARDVQHAVDTVRRWAAMLPERRCVLCDALLIDTAGLTASLRRAANLGDVEAGRTQALLGIFLFKFLGQGQWDVWREGANVCMSCERDDD